VSDDRDASESSALCDRFELGFWHDRAFAGPGTVARAATCGAVDTLLVDVDATVPGA
jgi:hypothetical protein